MDERQRLRSSRHSNEMGSPKIKHVMNMENFQDYSCSVSFVCRSSGLLCSFSTLVFGS